MRKRKQKDLIEDWRLVRGQESYLSNKTLTLRSWAPSDEQNDHDHCEFCFEKFSVSPDQLHEGYTTEDGYHWICPNCFEEFKERFGWMVIQEDKT